MAENESTMKEMDSRSQSEREAKWKQEYRMMQKQRLLEDLRKDSGLPGRRRAGKGKTVKDDRKLDRFGKVSGEKVMPMDRANLSEDEAAAKLRRERSKDRAVRSRKALGRKGLSRSRVSPGEGLGEGVREASRRGLASSWRLLLSTFGLSAIYLNLHFIVKYVAHARTPCRFGEEWGAGRGASAGRPSGGSKGESSGSGKGKGAEMGQKSPEEPSGDSAGSKAGQAPEAPGTSKGMMKAAHKGGEFKAHTLEIIEIMLLFLVDAILAVAVAIAVSFLVVTVWIITHPCEALEFLGEGLVSMIGPIVGPIVRIFVTGAGELTCAAVGFINDFLAGGG